MADEVTYHVYCNETGQIILVPKTSIPDLESWLYNDPEAFEAVVTGLREAFEGKIARTNRDKF
jgi:hypothetical protein